MMRLIGRNAMRRLACFAGIVAVAGLATAQQPASQPTAKPASADASSAGSGSACIVTGDAFVTKDQLIYSEAVGSTAFAKFTGNVTPLIATNFPKDAAAGRVQINTGGGFRLEGFTNPTAIKVFGKRDISVSNQLWLSAGVPLKIVGASPGKIQVEHPAVSGLSRPISVAVACDALSFSQGDSPTFEPPPTSRGYVTTKPTLDLYSEVNGSVVNTLYISQDAEGLVLWGTTQQGGFVRVTARSSYFIDAWVKLADVRLDPGARRDRRIRIVPEKGTGAVLSGDYNVMRAPKDTTLFLGTAATSPRIGTLEANAEIYLIQSAGGWANVLPKGFFVTFAEGSKMFWVKAADLGLAPPPVAK